MKNMNVNVDKLVDKEVNSKLGPTKCGYITCLHNTLETCYQEKCSIYERTLIQEY